MVRIIRANGQLATFFLITFVILTIPSNAFGEKQSRACCAVDIAEAIEYFVDNENKFIFFGLASYYNKLNYYIVNRNSISKVEIGKAVILKEDEWLAVVGRFNILSIKAPGLAVHLSDSKLNIANQVRSKTPTIRVIVKSELSSIAPELDQLRYSHLWQPIAWLAKVIESALIIIHQNIFGNWGWSIVIFSVLLKLFFLPVGVMTVKIQRKVSQVQTKLAPTLVEIKSSYDGEEAHNLLMAAHKELGVSPFYTLKPILGSFIQIPILIAVFNALGEMPQFDGQSFLWIKNLAFPDSIGYLQFSIPMFGSTISLLPFVMTAITLYSTFMFKNRYATEGEIKRQKGNLYFMATAFFVLFYPFPAAMVLYWTLANILQIIQQQFIRI